MAFQQEEDRTKLGRKLAQEAIALAVEGRWEEAVAANKSIVERFPDDVAAYNRLGRAYIELGSFGQAEDAYRKTLEVDHGNSIASKNIERLKAWANVGSLEPAKARSIGKDFFAATAGKTGVVGVSGVVAAERLEALEPGSALVLRRVAQQVLVEDDLGTVLGELEPKHGVRLARLMQGGNSYSATLLSTGEAGPQLLVKEDYQHPSMVGKASFPPPQADKLYGSPVRISPIETPPIVDEGRKAAASLRTLGDDSGEPLGEEDDKGHFAGFTLVDEPREAEESIE
ncbi:tetratricopeptide repeat protein [Chloroflexota bacterium]